MAGIGPRDVPVATIAHPDHPAHGAILLKVTPGISDLIVLNDGPDFGLDIQAAQFGTTTQTLDGRSGSRRIKLVPGGIHTDVLRDVSGLWLLRSCGRESLHR
ncbi:MAG: hypothetical protein GTO24_02325 [candidate division Zixibacteria bacterium]|nr:hypothetical protein [candidate division Zixibacteria bacterium]